MGRVFHTLLIFVLAAPATAFCAEVLVLKSGGKIVGEWLNPDETPRKSYLFRTAAGGQLAIKEAEVDRILQPSLAEQQYEQFLPKMPDTVEGQWTMAEWCRKNGLEQHRQTHLKAILQLTPDHIGARHGLGFSKVDGRWIKTGEYMREQGFVRYRGTWRLPMDVQREQRKNSAEEAEKKWRHDLKVWRGQIGKRRGVGAIERIAGVRDFFAAPALADMLDREKNPSLKEAYITALATMDSSAATAALIKHSLEQPDERIRDMCRDALKQNGGRRSAAQSFIKALSSNDNSRVNRAAAALAVVGDKNAVLPLITALVTEHKFKVGGGGGGMTTAFGGGNAGFSTGGNKPKIITQHRQNPSVLGALVVLTQGANYQYDEAAWRRWYTRATTPPNLKLRRSN